MFSSGVSAAEAEENKVPEKHKKHTGTQILPEANVPEEIPPGQKGQNDGNKAA